MSVVCFFSAKGAPGTTTAAMLAASLWPGRALLVDCDPVGGDVGLRLSNPYGQPLDLTRGMLTLLPLARRTLHPNVLLEHAQSVAGGGEVIVGLSGPEQSHAGGQLWSVLADAFRNLEGYDVIVDVGRVDSRSPLMPIVQASDVAVCVLGTSVSSVVSTRSRLHNLAPAVVGTSGRAPLLGMAVQAPPNSRDVAGAVATIREDVPGAEFLGHLATDRVGAGIFDGRPVSRPERTLLVRSGQSMVATLANFVRPPVPVAYAPAGYAPAPEPVPAGPYSPLPALPEPGPPTPSRREQRRQQRAAAATPRGRHGQDAR